MPPTNTEDGLRAAMHVRATQPHVGVLVLSQFVEEAYALDLIGDVAAVVGYLLKDRVADAVQHGSGLACSVARADDQDRASGHRLRAHRLRHWTREHQNVELPFCGFPTIASGSSLLEVQVVKPGADRRVPRGVVGGAEVSQLTTGATNIYMGVFRVPAGAQSRPHFHADCESAVYMLAGRLNVRWGEELEHGVTLEPGDMVYVPPRETHLLENPSETEAAEYVVARDAPQEDSVEVPWAG